VFITSDDLKLFIGQLIAVESWQYWSTMLETRSKKLICIANILAQGEHRYESDPMLD
jgi:hypothetical protein